jgi:hypothetical protein
VGAERAIWLARSGADDDPAVPVLETGRDRGGVVARVLELCAAEPATVVAVDASFSLAAWFLDAAGYATADELWADTAAHERWLREEAAPFWGRRRPRPPELAGDAAWRRTEAELRRQGLAPKSTFQIGGAGAVGTGSLRVFRHLGELRRAGCAIWPFHPPAFPLVVECYPRACTGPVVKRDPTARAQAAHALGLRVATPTEDAFDAAATALALTRADPAPGPGSLPVPGAGLPAVAGREGWVWVPTRGQDSRGAQHP